ncbi:MAG: hypothetical protein V1749_01330 [Candidatus Desantisbacteria bacterium]
MAISMAVYNTIRQIVDEKIDDFRERIEEIKIERKDFDELKGEVTKLTISVNKLAEAQTRTEQKVEELAEAQTRTEQHVERLDDSVNKLAQAQTRTEQSVERLDDSVNKLAQAQTEMKQAMKQLAINIGGLSDTIGFGLEDIARIVVPGYLERHEDIYIEELQRGFVEIDGVEKEIDLFGECNKDGETILIIGEIKSRIYEGEVKRFVSNVVNPIRKTEQERRIYPLMFGYVIHPSAQRLALTENVHLVASYQR